MNTFPKQPPSFDSSYPFSDLELFPSDASFEGYKAANGEYPPAYDRTKPRKYWRDPAALQGKQPGDPYEVSYRDMTTGIRTHYTITCGEAAVVNIHDHPAW